MKNSTLIAVGLLSAVSLAGCKEATSETATPTYVENAASLLVSYLGLVDFNAECSCIEVNNAWFVACKPQLKNSPLALYQIRDPHKEDNKSNIIAVNRIAKKYAGYSFMQQLHIDIAQSTKEINEKGVEGLKDGK